MKNREENQYQQATDKYLTSRFDHSYLSIVRDRKKQWLIKNYSKIIPSDKNSRILEIGPGYGELLEWLSTDLKYSNVLGIDISSDVVDFCSSILPGMTKIVSSSSDFIKNEASSGEKFDAVFMLQILEHLKKEDALTLIREIYLSLSEKGLVVIEVPNMLNPLVGVSMRYNDFTHEMGYTPESLSQVLRLCGFSDISVYDLKPPTNSFLRKVQYSLQLILNTLIRVLLMVYFPTSTNALFPSFFIVAKRT